MPALLSLSALFGAALFWVALGPAVVNGDGLGYLRAAVHGGVYAGHLGYVPMLRVLFHMGLHKPVELLPFARALSVVSGLGCVAAFAATARRLKLPAWLPASCGLAASFAVVVSASDVECYAPALCALLLAVYFCVRQWDGAAALLATAAVLIHVENVLFLLPLFLLLRRRAWIVLPVLVVVGAYLWSGISPLGASHGYHYPLRATAPAVALYGAAKALVFSPYPYEASWAQVIGAFAVGAIALAVLMTLAFRGGAPLGRWPTLAWALPYAAVGVLFFPSDHERWIFLLPLVWLSAAAAPHARAIYALAIFLTVANVTLWAPRARDDSWRRKAQAATQHLREGDLVISPGHGWDEYVSFWSGPEVRPFPLAYFAGALGGRAPLEARLKDEMARAPRVIILRDGDDGDPMGWKELRLFGINDWSIVPGERVAGALVPLGDGVSYLRLMGATPSRN